MSTWTLSVVLVGCLLGGIEASHFRGSIITWKPVPSTQYTVEFSYKIAWRRTSQNPQCTEELIQNQMLLSGEGSWDCGSGCSGTISSASFICTDYSEVEDWTQGEHTFQHTFDGPGPFVITHDGCCWVALVGGGGWSVSTTVDLNRRPDNGLINSSPVSASAPIIRLIQGCTYSLLIHTDDPDGDEVRCRMGVDASECGAVCQELPGATVTSNPCTIQYAATTVGWFAVALMIEDFVSSTSNTPLSKVPLQFLINVRDGTGQTCATPLLFSESTIKVEQRCIAIAPQGTFSTTVEVIETSVSRLKEVHLVAPPGLSRSPIQQIGSNRGITIQWTPISQQYGQHVFCFTALDSHGFSTEQRCVTLLAGASTPDISPNTMTPKGSDVPVNQRIFKVTFDQEIYRPSAQRSIRLFSTALDPPEAIVEIDTSQDAEVSVQDKTLTFYLPEILIDILEPGVEHYILMDPGAVVGSMSCSGGGAPFRGISDPSEWSFETVVPDTDPCQKNDGKGDCEYQCHSYANIIYQCWCDDNSGFLLARDGHSCIHMDVIDQCACINGACRGGGACECFIGWEGLTCASPSCRYQDGCSGNGDCIAPGLCACKPGWGGPACNIDLCSRYQSCYSCTQQIGCGWCDETKGCSAGSGYGPARSSCPAWFYYYCHAIVEDAPSPGSCSLQVTHAQCRDDCLDNDFLRTSGPGSYEYCNKYVEACKRYAKCYSKSPTCLTWYEDECRFGLVGNRLQRRQPSVNGEEDIHHDVLEPQDSGPYVVNEVARRIQESGIFPDDKGLLRRIAWVESRFGWDSGTFHTDDKPVGIWKMDNKALEDTQDVEAHPHLKKQLDLIREIFGINWRAITPLDLHKPLVSGLAARLLLSTKQDGIPKKVADQAEHWKKHYTNDTEATAETFLKKLQRIPRPGAQEQRPNCNHGIFVRETDSCLCEPDYTGPLCDQLDCGCQGSRQCSGNGVCARSAGPTSKPICKCTFIWEGNCCEICPPVSSRTDPHLETIDGFPFDYFGIGEFVSCYSVANSFGVELRFYEYKHSSLIGAAAIKVGEGVASVVTLNSTQGQYEMPSLRINGTMLPLVVGATHTLADNTVTLFVNPSKLNGSLAQLYFQFKNGATYTIEIRYSYSIGRQFLDTSLGAPIPFMMTTSGLCGNMDGNPNNDFVSPNGTLIETPNEFAETWRVIPKASATAGYVWSWTESNFHSEDPLTYEYTDPNHVPIYGLDHVDADTIVMAENKCMQLGLQEQLLQDCMLDIAVTDDDVFLQQHVFSRGKCHADCSNHGDCVNGTCQCSGLWTGEACNEGGCASCPANSVCVDGFCRCRFGYYEEQGLCLQALCTGVHNCTAPSHGRCQGPDDCLCNPGFAGDDCSDIPICFDNCNGHGSCTVGSRCICDPNWSGDRCDRPTCEDLQGCSGNGVCDVNATCSCESGWTGSSCAIPDCSGVGFCSLEGDCVGPDTCECFPGYGGPDCSKEMLCPNLSNCSGNGVCSSETECLCYDGFTGATCETPICEGNCSGHGTCSSAYFCQCEDGWIGADCSQPSCAQFKFCSGHGQCSLFDHCDCDTYWTGDACDVPDCPSAGNDSVQCSGNGECIGPDFCFCQDTHFGKYCQRPVAATVLPTPPDISLQAADGKADFQNNVSVLVGGSLILSCFADGRPELTVQILKEGQDLTAVTKGNHTFVMLMNLEVSDSGVYSCQANNSYGFDMRDISVLVMDPPAIVQSVSRQGETGIGEDAFKYVGDRVVLSCNAIGHPNPTVTWTLNGQTVKHGYVDGVELRGDDQILLIANATVNHAGNYTCTATNLAGTANRTSRVDVSPCRPSLTSESTPRCLYTVFLVEESYTLATTRTGLQGLASQLHQSLLQNDIGVTWGNHFSLIGFGTRSGARVIRVGLETIFRHDQVSDAVKQLRSDGATPDGYQAIRLALGRLPVRSGRVRKCPIHLVLVTNEPRSIAVSMSERKLDRLLCRKKPLILNAIVNVGLAVRMGGAEYRAMGMDWHGFPYLSERQKNGDLYKRVNIVNQTIIRPARFSVCSSFKDYGNRALQSKGSLWDIYSSFSYSKRLSLFSALVNSTLTSLTTFRPCVDCRCKRDNNGNQVKTCYVLKDNDLCNCRISGVPIRRCKKTLRGLCKVESPLKALPIARSLMGGCQNV